MEISFYFPFELSRFKGTRVVNCLRILNFLVAALKLFLGSFSYIFFRFISLLIYFTTLFTLVDKIFSFYCIPTTFIECVNIRLHIQVFILYERFQNVKQDKSFHLIFRAFLEDSSSVKQSKYLEYNKLNIILYSKM